MLRSSGTAPSSRILFRKTSKYSLNFVLPCFNTLFGILLVDSFLFVKYFSFLHQLDHLSCRNPMLFQKEVVSGSGLAQHSCRESKLLLQSDQPQMLVGGHQALHLFPVNNLNLISWGFSRVHRNPFPSKNSSEVIKDCFLYLCLGEHHLTF